MNKLASIGLVAMFVCVSDTKASFTTLDMPGAQDTFVTAIDGNNIAGYSRKDSDLHGFVYDGATWTTGLGPHWTTVVTGIYGNRIAGWYCDGLNLMKPAGFVQDYITGVDTILRYPGAAYTMVSGFSVDGNVIGHYEYNDPPEVGSFVYDGTTLNTGYEPAFGISTGDYIIDDNQLYNQASSTYLPFEFPGAYQTYVMGISGNTIVGYYDRGSGSQTHGFTCLISDVLPEPTSLGLLAISSLVLLRRRPVQ